MCYKTILTLLLINSASTAVASNPPHKKYTENNTANVSFNVSMPIDSTGFILQGNNTMGGITQFTDNGFYFNSLLAKESGAIEPPVVTNKQGKTAIKTTVNYKAIKFINPNGVNNLFIKVGMGTRTQTVNGLDPKILKDGTYTWQAPIFAIGHESDTVDNKSHNIQFMQVGSVHGGPASANVEYTQDFYLYSKGNGNTAIMGQPVKTDQSNLVLSKPYTTHYACNVDGLWGAGGADPYRTITGKCQGTATTQPAGPNLDYEYGSFTFPTIATPWGSGIPSTHCTFPGSNKKHPGCVNSSLALGAHYIAQKIRVPLDKHITLFAESGTAYRNITPKNLRYICQSNMYLKKILPQADCNMKSYLPGGASYTFFAVGYDYTADNGKYYEAKYMNIPGEENANRLVWLDASNTYIYAINTPPNDPNAKRYLNQALKTIQKKIPDFYNVVGKYFFVNVLKNNNLL